MRIAVGAIVLVALLVAAPAALAHLTFQTMEPSGAAELAAAPAQVVLTFDKPIGEGLREVTITSPDGSTDELAPVIAGAQATMQLPPKMAGGLWRVEWSAIGADGHPVRDSRTFTIQGGDAAANAGSDAAAFPEDAWRIVSYVGRVAFFGGLMLFVGGGVFAVTAARGFQPAGWGAMATAVIVGAIVVLAAHAAILDRLSLGELLAPDVWWDTITAQGGRGYALGALLVFACWKFGRAQLTPAAWTQRDGGQPWLLLVALLATAAMPTLSSHAVASGTTWVRVPVDVVHVLAGAIWMGGLLQLLALTIPRRRANPGIPDAVDVYSFLAAIAVTVIVVTGAFAAIVELDGDVGMLFSTTYGRLVLAKVALLGLVAPLAWANRQRHVPALRERGPEALTVLRQYVRRELLIAGCIVLATAALVHSAPGVDHSAHGGSHTEHQT